MQTKVIEASIITLQWQQFLQNRAKFSQCFKRLFHCATDSRGRAWHTVISPLTGEPLLNRTVLHPFTEPDRNISKFMASAYIHKLYQGRSPLTISYKQHTMEEFQTIWLVVPSNRSDLSHGRKGSTTKRGILEWVLSAIGQFCDELRRTSNKKF